MEELLNAYSFEKGIELYNSQNFKEAEDYFKAMADQDPENKMALLYSLVCNFLAGEHSHLRLDQLWTEFLPILKQCSTDSAAEAKQILSACTASTYRSCNAWQETQYRALNQHVNLNEKEDVLDGIQKTLLDADMQYRTILDVMYDFINTAAGLPGREQTGEPYFISILSYLQMALNLQTECGLENHISLIDAARLACSLPLNSQMRKALTLRNEILTASLTGREALNDWSYFEPFALQAGISRESLEKKCRASPASRLKTWFARRNRK